MKRRVLRAERTPETLTRLFWEDDSWKKGFENYLLTSGAVVWPHEIYPGIVLMAGQEQGTETVVVFEEKEFRSLSEAANIFDAFWNQYLPTYYFFKDLPENLGFIRHLKMNEKIQEKTPFAYSFNAKNPDYGNQLIRDFLSKNRLKVPSVGILAAHLQANWANFTSSSESLYGIEALRYRDFPDLLATQP